MTEVPVGLWIRKKRIRGTDSKWVLLRCGVLYHGPPSQSVVHQISPVDGEGQGSGIPQRSAPLGCRVWTVYWTHCFQHLLPRWHFAIAVTILEMPVRFMDGLVCILLFKLAHVCRHLDVRQLGDGAFNPPSRPSTLVVPTVARLSIEVQRSVAGHIADCRRRK